MKEVREKKSFKEEYTYNMNVVGTYVKQYSTAYITVFSIISALEVFFTCFWILGGVEHNSVNITYLCCYVFLFIISVISLIFVILGKKGKVGNIALSNVIHGYSLGMILWATSITLLDLYNGSTIIVHATICMILAGIMIVSPLYLSPMIILSTIALVIYSAVRKDNYFRKDGEYNIGAFLNVFVFYFMVLVMSLRHYKVRLNESRRKDYLKKLSYTDVLTGLGNETAYFEEVDRLNERIKNGFHEFKVVVMDVNNVKITNDTHGHRFGCHLIVRCGKTLPGLFPTSKVFHVGGDEFIAIIYGDDYTYFDDRIAIFDEVLRYSLITFEEKELIFSVARGYGDGAGASMYKDAFQIADDAMYVNKKEVKKEHNMKSRNEAPKVD